MPSSFCEFWWEIEERFGRYRRLHAGLNYCDIPQPEESRVLEYLQAACEQLQSPELFGLDDPELLRQGPNGPARYMSANFSNASRHLRAIGIRVPHIQDRCLQHAVTSQEICTEWESLPPRFPVNSVQSLVSYVRGSWNQSFDFHRIGDWSTEELFRTMSVTLFNFRATADWLQQADRMGANPIPAVRPRSFARLQRHVLVVIDWLEEQCLANPPDTEKDSDRASYLDLVVNEDRCTVTRRGDHFVHVQPITIAGSVVWPLFRALFAKVGAELTPQEINALPGDNGAARRTAKGRLNNHLRPLEVVIPNGSWQLLDACQRNTEVAPAQ